MQSDTRLAALTRRGHDAAFAELVRRHRERVERYCRRLLPGVQADEAVEETFLNAWAALGTGARPAELRPWLQRIAHHAAVRAIAARAHMRDRFDDWAAGDEVGGSEMQSRVATTDALVAIGGLESAQRDALVLAVRGYRHEQAALALGLEAAMDPGFGERAVASARGFVTSFTPRWVAALCARRLGRSAEPRLALVEAPARS
jgi:RNA polymerase sigma-70 factor (ECF subfamily)